jgi:hypothetical protein
MSMQSEPEKTYAGRPAGVVPLSLSLDREAAALLAHWAPTKKARGRFLSRLLYEHDARMEERQKVRQALEPVLAEEVV